MVFLSLKVDVMVRLVFSVLLKEMVGRSECRLPEGGIGQTGGVGERRSVRQKARDLIIELIDGLIFFFKHFIINILICSMQSKLHSNRRTLLVAYKK